MQAWSGDPNSGTTAVVGVVGAVLFAITIALLTAYFGQVNGEQVEAKIANQSLEADALRESQLLELSDYRRVDDAGTITIPIERAMEVVAAELSEERLP